MAETATPAAARKGERWSDTTQVLILTASSFVEYETAADLAAAVEKLDNSQFKDATVRCISDVSLHGTINRHAEAD